jgi:hypothetical protein
MKNLILLLSLLFAIINVVAQNAPRNNDSCFVLSPDNESGIDAILHGLYSEVNKNYGNQPQFCAARWTFSGDSGTVRSLIDFRVQDFVPPGAQITSAILKLYGLTTNNFGFGQHDAVNTTNSAWLERVVTNWYESTVTWNTQPQTDTTHRVAVPASLYPSQNYTIDVTPLVTDIMLNPLNSYGFMFKQQTEHIYRRLNFYSTDYSIDSLRPTLKVCYVITTDIQQISVNEDAFNVFPNPANNHMRIKTNIKHDATAKLSIYSEDGKLILMFTTVSDDMNIDISDLSSGYYIVELVSADNIFRKKLIVQ